VADPKDPESIFELKYFTTDSLAQSALDAASFGDPPVLHLPSHVDIVRIRLRLQENALANGITDPDILFAYQELALSASSSDIVCGQLTGSHRCGGLMDIEVSVFGAYYQCRRVASHRFPV